MNRLRTIKKHSQFLLGSPLRWTRLAQLYAQLRKATANKTTVVCLVEHLGDIVAAEPIVRHLQGTNPGRQVWVMKKEYAPVAEAHPEISGVIIVNCLCEWILLKRFFPQVIDLNLHGRICARHRLRLTKPNTDITTDNYYHFGNLLSCFTLSAGLQMNTAVGPQCFLKTDQQLPCSRPFIVLHTTANDVQRMWTPEGWARLVKLIKNLLPTHQIVEIGATSQLDTLRNSIIDYTGIKNLHQIATLIKDAALFIGVDSGFAHIANAFNINSLILLGHYGPFSCYMPYSGYFLKERGSQLFFHEGLLSELPFENLQPSLTAKLATLA